MERFGAGERVFVMDVIRATVVNGDSPASDHDYAQIVNGSLLVRPDRRTWYHWLPFCGPRKRWVNRYWLRKMTVLEALADIK